jgi:hypothetical protein
MAEGSDFKSRQGQELLPLYVFQTGSGDHPASYSISIGALSQRVKRLRSEADHLTPTSVEVKKRGSYIPTPDMPSWLSIQLFKHKDNILL